MPHAASMILAFGAGAWCLYMAPTFWFEASEPADVDLGPEADGDASVHHDVDAVLGRVHGLAAVVFGVGFWILGARMLLG